MLLVLGKKKRYSALFLNLLNWLVEICCIHQVIKHLEPFWGLSCWVLRKPHDRLQRKTLASFNTLQLVAVSLALRNLSRMRALRVPVWNKNSVLWNTLTADIFLVLLSERDFNMPWLVWWLAFRLFCFPVSEALGHCQNSMKLSQTTGYWNRG